MVIVIVIVIEIDIVIVISRTVITITMVCRTVNARRFIGAQRQSTESTVNCSLFARTHL